MIKDFIKLFTLESPIRAMPMDSFLFIPPERILEREFRLSSRFKIWIIRSTSPGIFSLE